MRKVLIYLAITLPLMGLLTVVSYVRVDHPLALTLQNLNLLNTSSLSQANYAVWLTQVAYCLMLPIFVVYYFLRLKGYHSRLMHCIGLISVSICMTYFIKTCLQFFFGRYNPRSIYPINTHFKHLKFMGFHFMHGGASFPSGHMSILSAGLVAICCFYRICIYPTILLLVILAALLSIFGYHFISDIIAGLYLGTSVSLGLYYLRHNSPGKLHN